MSLCQWLFGVYPCNPCNHEEFDTRVINYMQQMQYHKGTGTYYSLLMTLMLLYWEVLIAAEKLWVAFRMGIRNLRSCPSQCHVSCQSTTFHALTGCDNTSFSSGIGRNLPMGSVEQSQTSQLHYSNPSLRPHRTTLSTKDTLLDPKGTLSTNPPLK